MSIESASCAIDFDLNDADGAPQEESRAPSRSGELCSTTYRQLKQIAHRERTRDNHTLNTTGLCTRSS